MSPRFRHRVTKKESRRWPRPAAAALEERIGEIMDRVARAGDDQAGRAAVLEEYLTLARAYDGETWFDAGAWSEELADSYLALGRVDDAVATIANATRWGYAEGAEMLCELAGKLMRSGHELQARPLWQHARSGYPGDVWIYVQAGIEYRDMGGYAEALDWLTAGLELALRTGDPESALEQLRPAAEGAGLLAAVNAAARLSGHLRVTRGDAEQMAFDALLYRLSVLAPPRVRRSVPLRAGPEFSAGSPLRR